MNDITETLFDGPSAQTNPASPSYNSVSGITVFDEDAAWSDRYRPPALSLAAIPARVDKMLQSFAAKGEMPNLLIFGPPGIGKSTIARCLAMESDLELVEANCSLDRGIDAAREIRAMTRTITVFGRRRLIHLNEFDNMTANGYRACRDILEGASSTSTFAATCNRLDKVPGFLQNRFYVIDLEAEIMNERAYMLDRQLELAVFVLESEAIQYESTEVRAIVERCFPSMRSTLNELQARAASGPIVKAEAPVIDKSCPIAISLPERGADLLDALELEIARYIVTSRENHSAIALYIIHAHALEAAQHAPGLWFSSPVKRCGKTTAMRVVSKLVPNPLYTTNITVAGLVRVIVADAPTIFIDEMEHALKAQKDIQGVLNASHTRDSMVVRADGQYNTWCAKIVALIGELPDETADRFIRIGLLRRLPNEKVDQFDPSRASELDDLNVRCARWAAANLAALKNAEPDIPANLHDRAQDNWRPLLAIADVAGGDWPSKARAAAQAIESKAEIEEPSQPTIILSVARDLLRQNQEQHISSNALAKAVAAVSRSKEPILGQMIKIARVLRGFEVERTTVRAGLKTEKGYRRADLEKAFARYLPPPDAGE